MNFRGGQRFVESRFPRRQSMTNPQISNFFADICKTFSNCRYEKFAYRISSCRSDLDYYFPLMSINHKSVQKSLRRRTVPQCSSETTRKCSGQPFFSTITVPLRYRVQLRYNYGYIVQLQLQVQFQFGYIVQLQLQVQFQYNYGQYNYGRKK